MSSRCKKVVFTVLAIVLIYAFTPFVAGVVGRSDPRGPKIFAEDHHYILYRIGYVFAGRGKPRIPYMRERSWFYGIEGERTPEREIRNELEALSQQR